MNTPLKIISIIFILTIPLKADYSTNAYIDWQKGYVSTIGRASIVIQENGHPIDKKTGINTSINKARRDTYSQALEDAVEKIVDKIKTIRIDPEKSVNDFLISDNSTQQRLSKNLLYWLKIDTFPSDFYTSICDVRLYFGDLITAFPIVFPKNQFPIRDFTPISTYYTGLIIDTRGLDIEPMLLPSIYSEDGLEIYGKQFIDNTYIKNSGMISYCYNEDQAVKNKRAGDKPYFTIALKSIRNCPVISERDTRRILSNMNTINNLKKCRVIFILDRE